MKHLSLTHLTALSILLFGLLVSGSIFTVSVLAQEAHDIAFPVAELGNCESEEECRAYCDREENFEICFAFAKANNLLTEEELELIEEFDSFAGPGGCKSDISCEVHCNDIRNIDECLAFAEEHDVLSGEELEEARAVQRALSEGAVLPGGCTSKAECEEYCTDPSHGEECINFATAAGFIPPEEVEQARNSLRIMAEGRSPGGCMNEEECETYCANEVHFGECVAFAEEAGFISSEEAELARKTGGSGPGGCKGKDECDTYCEAEGNFSECIDFAETHGLISPEDAELGRRTGGKGPGGCEGRDECEAYCSDEAHQQECFDFAKEHGLGGDEDDQFFEKGQEQVQRGFEEAPDEVRDCIISEIGGARVEAIIDGRESPSPEIGESIRSCYDSHFTPDEGFVEEFRDDFDARDFESFDEQEIREQFEERFKNNVEDRFDGASSEQFTEELDRQFEQQFEQEFKRQFEDVQQPTHEEFEAPPPRHTDTFPSETSVPFDAPPQDGGEDVPHDEPQTFNAQRLFAGALSALLSGFIPSY